MTMATETDYVNCDVCDAQRIVLAHERFDCADLEEAGWTFTETHTLCPECSEAYEAYPI